MRSSIIGAKRRYFDLICRIAETLRIVLGSFSCPSITCISYCDASAKRSLPPSPRLAGSGSAADVRRDKHLLGGVTCPRFRLGRTRNTEGDGPGTALSGT